MFRTAVLLMLLNRVQAWVQGEVPGEGGREGGRGEVCDVATGGAWRYK